MKQTNTIMLSVRIDYTHEGRDPQHELTAALSVLRDSFPTVEQGVTIESVEAYNHGEQIMEYKK